MKLKVIPIIILYLVAGYVLITSRAFLSNLSEPTMPAGVYDGR
jgi:hypothetical protein